MVKNPPVNAGDSGDAGLIPGMTELDVTEHTQALADSDAHSH